jgi:hypothetical protein
MSVGFLCDLPLVKVFADWASSPDADQIRVAMCVDVPVEYTAGIWALKWECFHLDSRFNLWRLAAGPRLSSLGRFKWREAVVASAAIFTSLCPFTERS